ncbi:MAG TPA: single-stranded-DNA-specific exonuclease RecJ [Gemmatimonadales bacterium]|nr:single-stranded-DNA-specific exonuclease RecJ [Gemmatimonadales bacterium]
MAAAPDHSVATQLATELNLPVPLAALLIQRGHSSPELARAFLRPDLSSLGDPFALAGMRSAVDTIVEVARAGGRILVHGDYDVDGQCASAVLIRALQAAAVDVHGFIPDRLRDGYDFGPAGIAEAERIGATLILTCDCGITAVEAVQRAKARGFRVIVTDHHLPATSLPPADAVLDPQRRDDTSGLRMLSGTGVAFKLVQAMSDPLGLPTNFAWHLLDLVALATIADVVPLVGENRVLVRHGLKLLANSRWPGLRALVATARLAGGDLRAGQVGFVVAPRLNAVGRLADARDGLKLLLADDDREAAELAARLEDLNVRRQALDRAILDEALAEVESHYADPEVHRAIVLSSVGWHPGVIGIVASRVVERYGRPTFLIGVEGAVGKGSGRSIDRFDLHAALQECGDLLERSGGHRMAAGLTIRPDRIDAFRERFNAVARERLPLEQVGPEQRVDLEVGADALDDALERLGRHLEPCGMGNPAPVFGLRGARLLDQRTVGSNHLKARVQSGGRSLDVIAFGWADRVRAMNATTVDLALRLEQNEWQGRQSLQGRVVAIAPG